MANQLIKSAEQTYVPAVPGEPEIPPYCTTVTRTSEEMVEVGGVFFGDNTPGVSIAVTSSWQMSLYQALVSGSGAGISDLDGFTDTPIHGSFQAGDQLLPNEQYRIEYVDETRTVCYPGSPGVSPVPAQVIEDVSIGWSGGASSVDSLVGQGYVRWQFSPSPAGIVVGLVSANESNAKGEAEHGFYAVSRDEVYVVERGVNVASVPGVDLSVSPFFYIHRDDSGQVQYAVPSIGFSLLSGAPSVGNKVLDAAFYTSGDFVNNPAIGVYHQVSGASLGPVTTGIRAAANLVLYILDGRTDGYKGNAEEVYAQLGVGIRARGLATIDGAFLLQAAVSSGVRMSAPGAHGAYPSAVSLPLGVSASISAESAYYGVANSALPAVLGIAADENGYTEGRGVLPAIMGYAEEPHPEIVYSVHAGVISSTLGSGTSLTGGVSNGSVSLPAVLGIAADENGYTEGRGVLPAIMGYGYGGFETAGAQAWLEPIVLVEHWIRPVRVYAEFMEELEVEEAWTATITVVADWQEGLELEEDWSLQRALAAAFSAGLGVSSTTSLQEQEAIQYALNLGTGGVSRYTGYDFEGFAETDQATYAWNAAGVYRLGAGGDDGSPVSATVDLGRLSDGTLHAKHVEGVYLGIATDGQVYLRLRAEDGADRVYRARQRNVSSRVNVGRGVTARKWDFVLEVIDATAIELDSVEFIPGVSARRWVR